MNRRLKILSSDDDEGIRAMLYSLLTEQGHEIEFARDSDEVFKNLGRTRYDLLILDVNTPGLNGYKVAEKISNNIVNRPKLLIFTARDIKSEELQFVSSGADAVISKGEPCDNILKAVDDLFAQQITSDGGTAVAAGELPDLQERSCAAVAEVKIIKLQEDIQCCFSKITRLEDLVATKNMRYEEFIRELLREKQRTEKNYLEFKRIEGDVANLKNWGYAVTAGSALAILRAFL